MRYTILCLSLILLGACSSKSEMHDEAEIITRVGVIKTKADVSMQQVEEDSSRVNTSVHARVSSGGGFSIGLGFLFSQLGSGSSDIEPVRYEVELLDGGQMTIYHDSRDFEVDDCVKIVVHPDEEKHPPTMQRNKDGCS